jgi:uncharacterized protein
MFPSPSGSSASTFFALQSLWTLLKRILGILAITYAVFLTILYFQQDAMLFPRPVVRSPLPAITGLTQTTVTTADGETLPALYLPPLADNPTILFFHGNGDQINVSAFLAEQFAAHGVGFAAVEYRGYPDATGKVSESGIMADGLAAFDWLKAKCQCDIVLVGHSLGTGVAVHVAAEREARAMALFAPYSSIVDVAAERFWFLPVRWLIKNPIRSDLRIGKVTEPTLMVHGKDDAVIPIHFGMRLFQLANEPRQFLALDAIGHNDVLSEGSVEKVLSLLKP